MFIFLPCSLCFYAIIGKERRRTCLTVIFFFYHILLNISAPLNMLYLPCLIAYCYLAARLLTVKKSAPLCVILCALPYAVLFAVRYLAYFAPEGFDYPVGFTVAVLFSTSYIVTQYRQKREMLGGILDLILYLSFFPSLIVGPIIRYDDFVRLVAKPDIRFGITNLASGTRMFAIGVIKRIAVGAVLYEMYDVFFTHLGDTPSVVVTIFILITLYFATFFTISGYIDIGVGLARMYGLSLETFTVADPFRASTFTVYFGNLFTGLSLWIDDYLVSPLLSLTGENKIRLPSLIRAACYGFVAILFIRSTPAMLALSVPVAAFFYIGLRFRLDERLSTRTGPRALMTVLTMTSVAVVWVFIMLGDPKIVVDYIGDITGDNAEYRMDQILSTFSLMKYLFVMLVASLVMWLSRVESYTRAPELAAKTVLPAAQYIAFVLLIVLFFFTVIFFLPQFSVYDSVPFLRLFI